MTGDLTQKDGERVWLNSIRNAFTVMASIAIHITAMFMLNEEVEEATAEEHHLVDREHSYIPDEIDTHNHTTRDYHLGMVLKHSSMKFLT